MVIAGAVAIGFLLAIALYEFIKEIKNIGRLQKIAGIVCLVLTSYCCSLYFTVLQNWIWLISGLAVGLFCKAFLVKTRLHQILENALQNGIENVDEEDFMNTKKGKIVMVLVILLIIYSIISTACIYRLNQKINSMVIITDELREEITR